MHHYTRVRLNLDEKYSSRKVGKEVDDDWIGDEDRFLTVPDYFGLSAALARYRDFSESECRVSECSKN